ncbi:ImmA/IrrE family metallo-endopeptidase [Lacticaseibacillus hulanensis]|jgi:Zn-dependent peptidase ImmA (M78 family)|uniref:ImmA/IrrE family metallo-endopeptidase n=1 Tax=Lacticaseibacillus hulanensis TaxID=2493111 RepID=UPI000FDC7906|nr:ImmA/IrrE family metallo-endopeptidase [Lacticaseibacillus hulanensis]
MNLETPATPDGTAEYIEHRYHTADPWTLCDHLNIGVHWAWMPTTLLGHTVYMHGRPVIALSQEIRYTPQAYAVLAHELGHVIMHAGIATFYNRTGRRNKLEYQADKFASTLLTFLYVEEHDRLPETIHDLECEYGVKYRE